MNSQQWEALSIPEKRVAIAKDVIKAVEARQYVAHGGSYVPYDLFRVFEPNDSIQNLLVNQDITGCEVCAIGACFLSVIRFENRLKVKDLDNLDLADPEDRTPLLQYFSAVELGRIEAFFEGSSIFLHSGDYSIELVNLIVNFKEKFEYSKDRLVAIMNHIISNNGELKIEEL